MIRWRLSEGFEGGPFRLQIMKQGENGAAVGGQLSAPVNGSVHQELGFNADVLPTPTATAPAGTPSSSVRVSVTTPAGTATTPTKFTYAAKPKPKSKVKPKGSGPRPAHGGGHRG